MRSEKAMKSEMFSMISICEPLKLSVSHDSLFIIVDNIVVGLILVGCMIAVSGSLIYGTVLVCAYTVLSVCLSILFMCIYDIYIM